MKSLKTILGICLVTASFGGAVVAATATFVHEETSPIEKASATPTTLKIYINTANWGDDATGVKYYSWSWEGDNAGAWYDFTKVEDHVYSITVPVGNKNFIFFRAGSSMSHGWDVDVNYWNKTGDVKNATGNCYSFTGYSTGNWTHYKDSYVYYISDSKNPTNNKIYSWGYSEQFGSHPGASITGLSDKTEVQGTMHFDGNEVKIYKIPYATSGYGGLQIAYNGSNHSSDKTYGHGYAYTWGDNDPQAAGLALELLLDIENARNSATWKGHSYSVCGISSSDATGFVNRYKALNAAGKGYINNTTTYTYTDASGTTEDNISYSVIMQRLSIISGVPLSPSRLIGSISNNGSILIVVIASLAIVSATGFAFYFARKKEINK